LAIPQNHELLRISAYCDFNDYYHQLGSFQIPAGPMKEIYVEVDKMNRNVMAISHHHSLA